MATNDSISTSSLEHIEDILMQIQVMAVTIRTLAHHAGECCGSEQEAGGAFCHSIGLIASNIGYMTDEGLGRLNVPRNDAAHWFLPPVMQHSEESNQGAA